MIIAGENDFSFNSLFSISSNYCPPYLDQDILDLYV